MFSLLMVAYISEETENDNKASYEVKDEPVDDRENERSQSRGAEQESNVVRRVWLGFVVALYLLKIIISL